MMRKPCSTPFRASRAGVDHDREMVSGDVAVAVTFSGALLGTEWHVEEQNWETLQAEL